MSDFFAVRSTFASVIVTERTLILHHSYS